MLNELHIENIAVIERADISFAPGLNVLTGETGAGKSIVIDSIGAVLGDRVSRELVRRGADRAVVTASFDRTASPVFFAAIVPLSRPKHKTGYRPGGAGQIFFSPDRIVTLSLLKFLLPCSIIHRTRSLWSFGSEAKSVPC